MIMRLITANVKRLLPPKLPRKADQRCQILRQRKCSPRGRCAYSRHMRTQMRAHTLHVIIDHINRLAGMSLNQSPLMNFKGLNASNRTMLTWYNWVWSSSKYHHLCRQSVTRPHVHVNLSLLKFISNRPGGPLARRVSSQSTREWSSFPNTSRNQF